MTAVFDVLPRDVDGSLVVAAKVDGRTVPLTALSTSSVPTPVTTRSGEGREVFRRSAGLALLEAARRAGVRGLRLGPSLSTGRVARADGDADHAALAVRLGAALADVVRAGLPLDEEAWPVERAIARFVAQGWTDAAELLETWDEPAVSILRCGELCALGPGPLLPSTATLVGVGVLPHPEGVLLDFGDSLRRELPRRPVSTVVLEARTPRFGSEMTRSERAWLHALGVDGVGSFNRACVTGRIADLVRIGEGYHEKRIAQIADDVKARPGVRVVAIAGPSASGKTTFIQRLKVQLEVDGLRPFELSLDDYYVDRELTARDASGEYDFEALEALDLARLDDDLTRLLAGETVTLPRYDFRSGKSLQAAGATLQLGASDVLLVEGLHALNPRLLMGVDPASAYRVFVHPATTLALDPLSLLDPSDLRLIRRLVRDRHQRGISAGEDLARWPSVHRAERLHVFPFQGHADRVFDTSLVYEASVLKVYAERYLLEVPRGHAAFGEARRLRHVLRPFVPIDADHVPPTSILREFIGRSGFSY